MPLLLTYDLPYRRNGKLSYNVKLFLKIFAFRRHFLRLCRVLAADGVGIFLIFSIAFFGIRVYNILECTGLLLTTGKNFS